MKQHRRSFVGRTLKRVSQLWKRRRDVDRRRARREAFLFETLEARVVMHAGHEHDPTLGVLPNIVLQSGSPQWVALDGFDEDGGTLTFTATSANTSLVTTNIPTGNESLKMTVAGFGDMYFQLFEHLSPRVTSRIIELVNSGFYDDTATNTINFHRILNDFVIQAGDPLGNGTGGSTLGDFDDQFHVDLQHNRSGLLSMAKSGDDTNDSQFFITEERNESQFIQLNGNPTGGNFTLTFFDQTTGNIAFDSSNFVSTATSIRLALQGLSRIGAGNVTVTHDPLRNSQGQITENRRWRVDFGGTLGHQEVVNLTANASGLTGGTNPSIAIRESKSARHLDFNHSIFGLLTQGESVRDAISNVTTNSSGTPTNPPIISNIDVIVDPENGALLLKAVGSATGETDITVRATDAQGNFTERTFHVIVAPDGLNGAPFLNEIAPVAVAVNQQAVIQLAAQDVEGDSVFFEAVKPSGNTVNYTISVDNSLGLVTITPPTGFVGTFNVLMGVRATNGSDTGDTFDTQLVPITVGSSTPSSVDLLAGSDTGISNTDNITNASTLNFLVSGVAPGATVKLKRGTEVLAEGVATGTTITLSVTNLGTFGDGPHAIQAMQTVGGIDSNPSTALNVELDTTPPGAFTSTPPTEATVGIPLSYNANVPGEGGTGFVFSLTAAPAGVSINPTTGLVNWTPLANQVGNHVFQVVATDAAGNSTQQTVNVTVDEPLPAEIEITLTLTKPDGSPLTSLDPNQNFLLNVFVEDVRATGSGVATLYFDIFFDAAKAEATGAIQFNSAYWQTNAPFVSGNTNTPGLIDELGSFGPLAGPTPPLDPSNPGEPFKVRLASIPMRAKASGQLTFATDPTEDPVNRPAAVYGDNDAVPFEAVRFGTTSITVDASFQAVADTANVNEDAAATTLNPLANDTIDPGSGNVLTISGVGATSNGGTVQITQNGTRLSYVPAANFTGTETFTYTVRNQTGETSTATFTVQVAPRNDSPVAVNDTANATAGGQAVVISVLANDTVGPDTNENVQNYTVTAVTQPSQGGTVAITAGGKSVTFTPSATLGSNVTFTYTISDGNGGTSTATVTINNDNPNVINDTSTVAEDSSGNLINVLANDTPGTGPNAGTTLSVTGVGTPNKGGTVTVGQNGNVVYTPAANFQGTETFTYTVSDGNNHTSTGTVTVTVTNSNDPPTATADTVTAFKNTPAVFDVLANDSSAPDPVETLIIDSATQPAHGTVTITNNGTRITYTPANNYTGPDSFTYIIKDASGTASQSATVTVNVQEFVPSSLAGFVYFDVDNDGRKDGSESAIAGVTITLTGTDINNAAVNRTLKTGADGSYKFDSLLPGNYTITETQPAFTIDGKERVGSQNGTSTQNDKIVITQLAQNTNGTNNNFGERGRQSSSITLRDFFVSSSKNHLTAAVNSSGAALWHSIKGNAFAALSNPVVSLVNGSQIKVEGMNGQSSPVAASLPVGDSRVRLLGNGSGNRLFQISPFTLTAQPANAAPTAVNDTFTVGEDATLNIAVADGVLKNDTDANGNPLTAIVVTQPAHGTLTLNANGSFVYTPTANYSGPDSFTYKANDGTADSQAATVNITVTGVNDAPTGVANSYNVLLDTARTVDQAAGVLANDTDPDNTTLTATVVTQPTHGTLTFNANGSFTYTPTTGYTGPDSFTYRVSDGTAQSEPVTVSLTVAANAAPTAVADQYSVNEDGVLNVVVADGVLKNDTDPNSQSLTAAVVAQPSHGTLTLNANGSFVYTPEANYNGPDSFTYKANDGALDSPTITVSLTVNPVNDAPTAVANSYNVVLNTALTVGQAAGVLTNDTDPDNATLTATVVTQPAHGTLTLNANGSFTYTPTSGYTGPDSFTYRVNDGTSQSGPATVSLTVATNAAPTAEADEYSIDEDGVLTVAVGDGVLDNDTDPNSQALTAVVVADPAHGTLTLATDGSFVYTPTANYSGPDSFTYKANDGSLDSATVTVSLTVNPVNDAPIAADDSFTATEGEELTIAAPGLLGNDTDPENDARTVVTTPVTNVAHGTLTLSADGSFTYTPEDGFTGTDTFTYKINDGTADSQAATVTITVEASGGGEGESAGDQALLAFLSESGDDHPGSHLSGSSEDWTDAVDEILSQL